MFLFVRVQQPTTIVLLGKQNFVGAFNCGFQDNIEMDGRKEVKWIG
jgi:hypothetical protein